MAFRIIHFILTLVFSTYLTAESIWVKYGWEIMDNGGDARALALGNTLTADGSSPISVLWNPAHQTHQHTLPLIYGHQNRFAGLVSSDVLVFPLKTKMTIPLGLVIIREGVSRIPDTRNLLLDWGADGMPGTMDSGEGNGVIDEGERLNLKDIKYFNQSQWAIHLSTSRNYKQFTIGVAVKGVLHNLGGYNGTGFGLDIGTKFSAWENGIIGLTVTNCTTSWLLWENGTIERTIPGVNMGVSHLFLFPDNPFQVRVNGDALLEFGKQESRYRTGLEVSYKSKFQIRFGRNNNGFLSTGLGLFWTNFSMDYAYRSSPANTGFGASHIISFRIDPLWVKNKLKTIL